MIILDIGNLHRGRVQGGVLRKKKKVLRFRIKEKLVKFIQV